MTTQNEPILEVKNLNAFYGDFQALFGIDIEIEEGGDENDK